MNRTDVENHALNYNVRISGSIHAAFRNFRDSVVYAQDLVVRNPTCTVSVVLFDKIVQFHHAPEG